MSKKIFGQIGRLKPDCIEKYQKLHMEDVYTERWKGVLTTIHACNIKNYSIFIQDDLVFGYFEYYGTDYDADMEKMAADPVTQEWWKETRPCFTRYSEDTPKEFYFDMKQIFCFE